MADGDLHLQELPHQGTVKRSDVSVTGTMSSQNGAEKALKKHQNAIKKQLTSLKIIEKP